MASSRINEHMEARRKQHLFDKKAYYTKRFDERTSQNMEVHDELLLKDDSKIAHYLQHMLPGASNSQQNNQPSYGNDRQSRKDGHLVVYSAKLPNRLSDLNFKQQW